MARSDGRGINKSLPRGKSARASAALHRSLSRFSCLLATHILQPLLTSYSQLFYLIVHMPRPAASSTRNPRTIWSSSDDGKLVTALLDAKSRGLQSDGGFKSNVWTECETALSLSEAVSGGAAKSSGACKARYQRVRTRLNVATGISEPFAQLKKDYLIVKKLRGLSGWGWDDARKMVIAEATEWERYLAVPVRRLSLVAAYVNNEATQANSNAKPFRLRGFPLYDDLESLAASGVASGAHSFAPGSRSARLPPPLDPPSAATAAAPDQAPSTGLDDDVPEPQESATARFDEFTPFDDSAPHSSHNAAALAPLSTTHTTQEIDNLDSSSDQSVTPVAPRHKRNATRDLSPSPVPRKRARPSGAAAISEIASAIRTFSSSLAAEASAGPQNDASPQRRAKAIQMAEDDEDMSDDEAVAVAKMFRGNMAIVDTFLAIPSKARRTKYLRSELDDMYNSR